MEKFHCFWREPLGNHQRYEMTDDFERVQELVKAQAAYSDDEYGNVSDLRVVRGSLLDFEAVEVVTKWRILADRQLPL